MNRVRRNLVANLCATSWSVVAMLMVVPMFVQLLGVEGYGLVGFHATILTVLAVFDLGLGVTASRETARLAAEPNHAARLRTLLATLAPTYWVIGAVLGLLIAAVSPLIAHYWLELAGGAVAPAQATKAIALMGLGLALQWPATVYRNMLVGLERQVLASGLGAGVMTLRTFGAVALLLVPGAGVITYFAWQCAVSITETLAFRAALLGVLPSSDERTAFRMEELRRCWHFASAMAVATVLGLILSQLDKVVLSKLLPLEAFGHYAIASVVAASLFRLVSPVIGATWPRLSALAHHDPPIDVIRIHQATCQTVAILMLPAAVTIAIFAPDVLRVWGQPMQVVETTSSLVSLLVIGTALNCLMHPPYALLIAMGWTRFAVTFNAIAVAVLLPTMIVAALLDGATGAAWSWIGVNVAYLTIAAPLVHRRLGPGIASRWYFVDVLPPLIAATLPVWLAHWLVTVPHNRIAALGILLVIGSASACAAALATPVGRRAIHALTARLARPAAEP